MAKEHINPKLIVTERQIRKLSDDLYYRVKLDRGYSTEVFALAIGSYLEEWGIEVVDETTAQKANDSE